MSLQKASIGNIPLLDAIKDLLGLGKKTNLLDFVSQISSIKDNADDIANIIKNVSEVDDIGKIFNFSGVSKGIAKEALEAANLADSIDDVIDSMNKASASQKGFKGLGTGFLGFVKSVGPTLLALTAIGTAIGIAYQQITKFSRSVENAKESQSNYSSTISELQSLDSEIDTTSSKIDELNSKGPLTLVEKSELQNLKLQNAELERQRDIKQKIADTQSRESIDDAMESLNMAKTTDLTQKTMQQQLLESDNWMDRVAAGQMASAGVQNMVYEQTDIVTATQNEVKALNDLKEAREKLYLERENESTTKKRKESIDSEISALKDEIDRYDSEVAKNMETLQELRNNFIEESTQLPRSNLTTKELQKYNSITDIIDEYVNKDPIAKQVEELSKIWKDDSFAQAQQKLVDAFRTGKDISVDEITKQFPDLVSACNDAGISVSTLREELMALASQDTGLTKLEDDFTSFQLQLVTAINAIDTVNASLANSFSGKGLNVEIDEETGAIVGDIANIKAAYQGLEGYDASSLFEKTANGVHINRQALRELQAQQESLQKATNLEKIAELQERLNQAMIDAKSKVGTEDYASSQLLVNDLKNQLEIAQELAAAYDGATSAYQKWLDAQSNGEEGDMFRNVSETMRERGNELYTEGRYNTNEFRAIADYFSNQDLSTASIEELVRAYESAKPTIDSFFTGNKQGIDNFMASMKQMSDEGNLGWVEELENGAMKFNVSTKTLADSLGISQEAVEALMRAADEYTDIVLSNDVGVDFAASIDEMSQKAEEAKSRLEELNNTGEVNVDLNFNFDSTDVDDLEAQIQRATSNLEQFKNQDGIVDLNINGANDAISILTTLIQQKNNVSQPVIMSIDTSNLDSSVSGAITKLQEYQTALNELNTLQELQAAGIQVDTSQVDEAKAKVDRVFSEIQGMSTDGSLQINADVSVDTSTAEALSTELSEMTPEIKAKIVADTSALELGEEGTLDKNATVTYDKDSSEPDNYKPENKTAKVIFKKDSSVPDNYVPKNKTAKVNYTLGTVAKPPSVTVKVNYDTSGKPKNGTAYGTFSSPAHADGTAYNVINTIPAHADGKVALQKNEQALVNEIGSEGLIRDGVLSWIPGGMHFENLKKGDIILSAEQMKMLFSTGKASGRGRAYADGTISARQLASTNLNAYAIGSGAWIYGNVGSGNIGGSGYISSDGNNNSSSNNSNNSNTNTSDLDSANDSAEEFKETLDAIEILINRIERDIKNIERVAGSAYNTFAKRNNALKNQVAAITEEISIQQQGYNRYLQEAESVPLSEDYKNLVRSGAIDISTITDKDLSENINKYKEW